MLCWGHARMRARREIHFRLIKVNKEVLSLIFELLNPYELTSDRKLLFAQILVQKRVTIVWLLTMKNWSFTIILGNPINRVTSKTLFRPRRLLFTPEMCPGVFGEQDLERS